MFRSSGFWLHGNMKLLAKMNSTSESLGLASVIFVTQVFELPLASVAFQVRKTVAGDGQGKLLTTSVCVRLTIPPQLSITIGGGRSAGSIDLLQLMVISF